MSQWFRMYAEVLDDPKVQRLNGEDFKGWVNILCLTAKHNGTLPAASDIAFALRMDEKKAAKLLQRLVSCGLLVEDETGLKPNKWDTRQYKSDVSTSRVKRFRERSKKQDETEGETAPDTETEAEVIPFSNENGSASDPDKVFWDSAKAFLGSSKASLIGKWVSQHDRPSVAAAIASAQAERAVDPIAFIEGVLRKNGPGRPKPRIAI
ncbi:hypothetical protein VHN57_08455 [Sphingobium sp. WW5]|uniref:hypothetical protein n=1 Tax=unclassified Sphingobium TaxID=2611147 RepID=UPI003C1D7AF0